MLAFELIGMALVTLFFGAMVSGGHRGAGR
jgi:hypothetical protein